MKYPTLDLARLPFGFKHCEIAVFAHFDFEGEGAYCEGEDAENKRAYVQFMQREIVHLMDQLMTLYRPGVVPVGEGYGLLMKDNVDMYKFNESINKLLSEVYHHTDKVVLPKVFVRPIMLMEGEKSPTLFKSNRMGEPLKEVEGYMEKGLVEFKDVFKPKELFFIPPYAEFIFLKEKNK